MVKRVEIYPTRKIAEHKFTEYYLNNETNMIMRPTLHIEKLNGDDLVFFGGNPEKLRGYRLREIYIHPDVSLRKRKEFIQNAMMIGATIVFKEND